MDKGFLAARLALAAAFLLVAWEVWPVLGANLQNRTALQTLDVTNRAANMGETNWEEGWRTMCAAPSEAAVTQEVSGFMAFALLDSGNYRNAYQQFTSVSAAELPNAPAYRAALEMDWITAAQRYQPEATARNLRWWGSIFYLAAQQQMFVGDTAAAAALYRRADAAYGVQGPYSGLALVDCLEKAGRMTEAFDAYRRALVTLPPDEALTHVARFEALRLSGLRQWQQQAPGNERVAAWLAAYTESPQAPDATPRPLASAPQPEVALVQALASNAQLLGFDYRPEDIETGPFMDVSFYWQEGTGEAATYWKAAFTVLNQAPNGSFAWDTAPDGVRPYGWHTYVYTPDANAIVMDNTLFSEPWLCLDAGRVDASFGLQSRTAPLGIGSIYVQGGQLFAVGQASLSLGRQWYGVADPYNYSYVGGRPQPDQQLSMTGVWEPTAEANEVAVWLLSQQTSRGCFRELYLYEVPMLRTESKQ